VLALLLVPRPELLLEVLLALPPVLLLPERELVLERQPLQAQP
jgi:hypothetical protein